MTGEPPRHGGLRGGRASPACTCRCGCVELSGFYEEAFGHVAVAEINAAWFQWIVAPEVPRPGAAGRARARPRRSLASPGSSRCRCSAILALIIRRDGGPAFFKQVRIGEGGKPFTIYKLRTMRDGADSEWATAEDARVTRDRALRCASTHLDELPQVLNVLRGEMSVVGPRPEQPGFVDRLEQVVPFYQRRHLMKPGLTGWAQVRCGYAGSDIGSAWKVCHDLYYLKHRSVGVDLVILCETLATLFFEREAIMRPENVAFVLADER